MQAYMFTTVTDLHQGLRVGPHLGPHLDLHVGHHLVHHEGRGLAWVPWRHHEGRGQAWVPFHGRVRGRAWVPFLGVGDGAWGHGRGHGGRPLGIQHDLQIEARQI